MDVGVDKATPSPDRAKGHTASQGAFGNYPKHKYPPAKFWLWQLQDVLLVWSFPSEQNKVNPEEYSGVSQEKIHTFTVRFPLAFSNPTQKSPRKLTSQSQHFRKVNIKYPAVLPGSPGIFHCFYWDFCKSFSGGWVYKTLLVPALSTVNVVKTVNWDSLLDPALGGGKAWWDTWLPPTRGMTNTAMTSGWGKRKHQEMSASSSW